MFVGNRNNGDQLPVINNGFQIWNAALQHIADMPGIYSFLASGNLDHNTVIISLKIISYIIHSGDGCPVCGHFVIQKIPDKIFIIKSTGILDKGIFFDLLIDIFFQSQQKFCIDCFKWFINSRHNDVSEVFTGIDGTVELFITKFAVKSPEWYFAAFYTFMNIVLTADHFEILIRKAFLFQCPIREILTFQFLKWSCDEIVI